MAYDLPNRQRLKSAYAETFTSSLSESPTLSPSENTATFELPADVRKGTSFLNRTFRSARPQANVKGETTGPLGLRSLFCAPESLVDIIFVHGLRGGSIKTWRFGEDEHLFWPRYWLPKEPEFAHASIHSYGYDSDWGSTKPSILSVHDFGRSLYEELLSSPSLRHSSNNNPIILVGHSMGGLVIKKAYILSQDDHKHPDLARRIRCVFFLATPHRGSDYAAVLNNILKCFGVTGLTSSREYLQDITAGSVSTEVINSEFARIAKELTVYSFYETEPTITGSSGLIVDKASAVLGLYPDNEHIFYQHANHREICKFRTRQDSTYIKLKDALATAVEDLTKNVTMANDQVSKEQMRNIEDLLRIQDIPEEYHEKLEGSCRWIEDREDFQSWIGVEHKAETAAVPRPSMYWVQAQPGAGKTVLATHIMSLLNHFRLPYSSHLFHFGKKSAQSLTGLLQSLAFQMARANEEIRNKLVEIYTTTSSFDQDDPRAIWNKVFLGGLFQVSLSSPQFWVIDAVDECVKYPELISLLKGIQPQFPLRLFFTSRKLPDMPRLLRLLDIEVAVVEIPIQDTLDDISLYVRTRITDLPVDEENEREDIAQQILAKSGTSFLWVRLVMDELEGVYGYDSIKQVLQAIPEGMFHYYSRAIAEMSEKKREQHVVKAILLWVMLATRPLSISELSHALQLDINVHLPSAKAAIEGLCGQLVSVDVHTGLVHPVHATAREFILSEEAGSFQVSRTRGHEQIALTCLRLLASTEFQPPRHRRLLLQKRGKPPISILADYAITQFSEHVVGASTESDELLLALAKFLKTTVLTWIEKIMVAKEAYRLLRAAKNLKAYLSRRAKYHSPLNSHVSTITAWTTDLTRVLFTFGRALEWNPASVYFLIPPLCPTESAMFQQFGKTVDGLMLSGYRRSEWSDCIASISFEEETAAAVACDNKLITVGMESGTLQMYNSRSYQKEGTIDIGSSVDLIHTDISGSFVAVSGHKFVGVWDNTGHMRWKVRFRHGLILLELSQDSLIGISTQGRSYSWDLQSGELVHEQKYTYSNPPSDADAPHTMSKAPSTASLSPGLDLIALAYRNSPVCIFDRDSGELIAWAVDENKRAAEQILFNPSPDVGLLLIAYNESHLALYDSWSGQLVESLEAENHVILDSVACAPDGRTFATVDVRGHLRIWDFETLTPLYHVLIPHVSFSLLHFTAAGLGLLHVTDHELKVWAPSALVRKTMEEEASLSDQSPVVPVTEGQFERFQASKINTLVAHPLWPMLLAGNQNGEVLIYQSKNGYDPLTLYTHHGIVIRCLASSRHNIIASADLHANVQVRQFDASSPQSLEDKAALVEKNFNSPVTQLLFDLSGSYLLVSTISTDYVYRIEDGVCVGSQDFSTQNRTPGNWFVVTAQDYSDYFLLLADGKLTAYSIKDFSSTPKILSRFSAVFEDASIRSVTEIPGTLCVIVETQNPKSHVVSSYWFSMPSSTVSVSVTPAVLIPLELCAQFLGISKATKRVVFMHPASWVCSTTLKDIETGQYVEHFFVPEEYSTIIGDDTSAVHPVQTAEGDFAFCMYDKVRVLKGGLKFQTNRVHT